MFRIHITSLILLSLLIHSAKSQSQIASRLEHLNMGEGNSLETFYCIHQDIRGFLWFGTLGSLIKYDGYRFSKYTPDKNDTSTISSNIINSIYEDRSGIMWMGTNNGLNRYNRDTDNFTIFLNDPLNESSLSNNIVMGIYEDSEGNLWIGTDGGGLNRFSRKTKKFNRYVNNPDDTNTLSHNSI